MTAPTPLEKKRLLGNPGHRWLPAPSSTHSIAPIDPTPPEGLGEAGRRLWGHVAALPWLGSSDAAELAAMCAVADLVKLYEDDLAEHGVAYSFRGRRLSNPSGLRLLEARKLLSTMSSKFGLSPGDRSRLGIAEVKAQSKLEELAERREARRAAQEPSGSGSAP